MQGQGRDFSIFLIEQSPRFRFNRGMLLNAATALLRATDYDYLVFHDDDLTPTELGSLPYDFPYGGALFLTPTSHNAAEMICTHSWLDHGLPSKKDTQDCWQVFKAWHRAVSQRWHWESLSLSRIYAVAGGFPWCSSSLVSANHAVVLQEISLCTWHQLAFTLRFAHGSDSTSLPAWRWGWALPLQKA